MLVGDVFDLFEGESPAGAGSAAALTGALATSLLTTIARRPRAASRPEQGTELASARATLRECGRRLVVLANRDRDAFRSLVDAYRLPTSSDQERDARQTAVQAGMKDATAVPLEMMDACCDALSAAVAIAACAPARARGEVAVGVELLKAAFHSARVCVDANLPAIADAELVNRLSGHRNQLESDATRSSDAIRSLLSGQRVPAS